MTPEEIALETVTRMAYGSPEIHAPGLWEKFHESTRLLIEAGELSRTRQYRAFLWALQQERAACIAACENEQVVGVGDPGSPQGHYNRACADCARAIEERGRVRG